MSVVRREAKPRKAKLPRVKESDIQSAILQSLEYRRDVVCWRSNTGAAQLPGKGGVMRPVFFGLPGAGDIVGLIRPWGTHLEIEVKRPGGKQNENQRAHETRVLAAGGIYILARDSLECIQKLNEAVMNLRDRFTNEFKEGGQ